MLSVVDYHIRTEKCGVIQLGIFGLRVVQSEPHRSRERLCMCAVLLGLGRTKGIAYVSDLYKVGPSTASGSRERRGVWPGLDPSLAYVVAEVSNNESSTSTPICGR